MEAGSGIHDVFFLPGESGLGDTLLVMFCEVLRLSEDLYEMASAAKKYHATKGATGSRPQ